MAFADSTATADANANANAAGGDAVAVANSNPNTNSNASGVVGDINSGNTSKNEAMERGFPVPGTARFGPVINYYGKPLPTAGFRPVESLLIYANIFSEGALESILTKGKNADLIVDLNVVRGPDVQVRAKYESGEPRWIKIIADTRQQKDHGLIGYITSEADDRKTDMMEVVAGAALEALREGADVLQIVAQGASRDTETSGWGIGFNTTQATMMGGQTGDGGANVSSGGTGYSTAWAGMRDKPWIQGNALKSPDKVVGYVAKTIRPPKTPAVVAKMKDKEKPAKQWGTVNGKKVMKVN